MLKGDCGVVHFQLPNFLLEGDFLSFFFRIQESCSWMRQQGEFHESVLALNLSLPAGQTQYSMLCMWQCTGCREWASGTRGPGAHHARAYCTHHCTSSVHHPQCRL